MRLVWLLCYFLRSSFRDVTRSDIAERYMMAKIMERETGLSFTAITAFADDKQYD